MLDNGENFQVCKSETKWSFTTKISILECIFANLELRDILSASLVSKSWCQGATKALEKLVNPVLKNARELNNLKLALWRFRRHTNLTLDYDQNPEEGSLPVLVSSVKKMPFLTSLNLHFESTQSTVHHVNGILAEMATGVFSRLQRLELFPYGEANLSLNPNESHNEVSVETTSSLQVLRVRVGHLSTLALDWKFLTHLPQLQELHILELKKRCGAQIQHFLNSFKENRFANPPKMDVSFLWPTVEEESPSTLWSAVDTAALQSLFDFVKPSDVSLILLTPFAASPFGTESRFSAIQQLIPRASLRRISVYAQVSESDFTNAHPVVDAIYDIAFSVQRINDSHPSVAILMSIDIDFGGGKKTFLEAERHNAGLHLSYRFGPKYGEEEQKQLDLSSQYLPDLNERPVAEYKRRFYINPQNLGGKITCSEMDTVQDFNNLPNGDFDFIPPQEVRWKEADFSEPKASLRAFLEEQTRYSKISGENVPICYCELYSVNPW